MEAIKIAILILLIITAVSIIAYIVLTLYLRKPSIPISTQIEMLNKRIDSIFTDIPKIECKHKRSKLIRNPNIYYCADCRCEVEID